MTHKIKWSDTAKTSLKEIILYIAVADSVSIADKILTNIEQAANDLCLMPERGRNIDELKSFNQSDYKFVMHQRWKIIYQIKSANQVIILLIIDSSRDFKDILFDTFSRQ